MIPGVLKGPHVPRAKLPHNVVIATEYPFPFLLRLYRGHSEPREGRSDYEFSGLACPIRQAFGQGLFECFQ
jgi:hypothetical protein